MVTEEFNEHARKVNREIVGLEKSAAEYATLMAPMDAEINRYKNKQNYIVVLDIAVFVVLLFAGALNETVCLISILVYLIFFLLTFIWWNDLAGKIGRVNQKKAVNGQTIHHLQARAWELRRARNCEVAGRYEDAARIYEWFGYYEDAGASRKMGRVTYTEHSGRVVNIELDLNKLLARISAEGLAIPYKCPNCGGSIRISGGMTVETLIKCQYCGYDLYNLAEFLRGVLS